VLEVFGRWAIVSGVAQLVAALHLRRPRWASNGRCSSPECCPSSQASALSAPSSGTIRAWTLVMYAAAGGAFFLIQDALLYWRLRKR
jgi:hypothetical protein